ncbi:MAG: cytochrome c peroxidase [Chitinophagales bacterium]
MNWRLLPFVLAFVLLELAACRRDPPVHATPDPNDPDSLYVGTPYDANGYKDKLAFKQLYRTIEVPADNPMTVEGIEYGRMLFYDSTFSSNKKVSCSSCHKQEYAFADNQVFSTNVAGLTKRNTSSLVDMGVNHRFFWDGRAYTIEQAVEDALKNEQHTDFDADTAYINHQPRYRYLVKKAFGRPGLATKDNMIKAIAQFIRTMVSYQTRFDRAPKTLGALTPDEQDGFVIFNTDSVNGQLNGDCFHCHVDGVYLTFANQNVGFSNNALDSVITINGFADPGLGGVSGASTDFGKFKIPTLRNVAVTAPYMHDGRFKTLEEVLDHYSEHLKSSPTVDPFMKSLPQGGRHLTQTQKDHLLAFLRSLTDTAITQGKRYSNPFY